MSLVQYCPNNQVACQQHLKCFLCNQCVAPGVSPVNQCVLCEGCMSDASSTISNVSNIGTGRVMINEGQMYHCSVATSGNARLYNQGSISYTNIQAKGGVMRNTGDIHNGTLLVNDSALANTGTVRNSQLTSRNQGMLANQGHVEDTQLQASGGMVKNTGTVVGMRGGNNNYISGYLQY